MWSSHGQRFHLQENSIISFAIMSILEHISSDNAIHFSIFSWSLLQFLRSHSLLLLKYDILFDLLTFFSDGYWGNLHVIRYVLCSTHVGSNNFLNDALLDMADLSSIIQIVSLVVVF